jgi:hypothetical protein
VQTAKPKRDWSACGFDGANYDGPSRQLFLSRFTVADPWELATNYAVSDSALSGFKLGRPVDGVESPYSV